MIGLKTFKVFLVDIHSVILFHARLHSGDERLHCVLVVFILLNLLAKAFDIALLCEVYILGPPPFDVLHASALHDNTLGVDFGFTVVWGRVDQSRGWVALDVVVIVCIRGKNGFQDLRLSIGEVARPSKFSSALRVLIGDFHGCCWTGEDGGENDTCFTQN